MKRHLLLLPLGFLTLLTGCGSGEKHQPTFEVVGKVTAGSKPVVNAQVVFHPVEGADPNVPKPTGRTDDTGTFRLTTYDGFDGAPAGQYRVSVELWKTVSAETGPVNQLPARYATPDKSNLSATISAGPNELQPFQIKR